MGRSSKESRPNQVCDGGGQVSWMGVGQNIKPKSEKSSGEKRADAAAKTRTASGATKSTKAQASQAGESGKSGWQQIGEAGADIVTELKRRNQES